MLEGLNSAVLVFAALCVFAIAYRFYGLFIATKVLRVDSSRRVPSDSMADGLDYHKTNRYVLFGHHFAAIAGAGPLTGPVLAAQFGFLPGALWILIGAVLGRAVHDVVVLFASVRHRGESLANIARNEIGRTAGRFLLQEMTGKVFPRFNDHNWFPGMIITGLAFTFMWGYLLYTGSISTIWPLFGISNQLLAACALIIVNTMFVQLGRKRYMDNPCTRNSHGNHYTLGRIHQYNRELSATEALSARVSLRTHNASDRYYYRLGRHKNKKTFIHQRHGNRQLGRPCSDKG